MLQYQTSYATGVTWKVTVMKNGFGENWTLLLMKDQYESIEAIFLETTNCMTLLGGPLVSL